jgi:hypothetical protein
MKTLTIDDTVYNLAYLISVKYKAKTKAATPRGAKSEPVESPQTLKSASTLDLHFLDCDKLHLKKDSADAVWNKLSRLLELDPDENLPTADESHPS